MLDEESFTDIFDNITDDDIELQHKENEVLESPDEYFERCKKMFSESIFIDISSFLMKFHIETVKKAVYRLSYILKFIFERYGIEHSDFILSDISVISSLLEDDVKMTDFNTYKYITLTDKKNDGYLCCMLYVYVNYPKMTDSKVMLVFEKILSNIWKFNKHRIIFSDIVLYKCLVNYKEYNLNLHQFPCIFIPHIDLVDMKSIVTWFNSKIDRYLF